jgi:hypothetical protein
MIKILYYINLTYDKKIILYKKKKLWVIRIMVLLKSLLFVIVEMLT